MFKRDKATGDYRYTDEKTKTNYVIKRDWGDEPHWRGFAEIDGDLHSLDSLYGRTTGYWSKTETYGQGPFNGLLAEVKKKTMEFIWIWHQDWHGVFTPKEVLDSVTFAKTNERAFYSTISTMLEDGRVDDSMEDPKIRMNDEGDYEVSITVSRDRVQDFVEHHEAFGWEFDEEESS